MPVCRLPRRPAGLQSEPARVQELRQFIQYAASLPDVWFVTNQQVWREGVASLSPCPSCPTRD